MQDKTKKRKDKKGTQNKGPKVQDLKPKEDVKGGVGTHGVIFGPPPT
jgi:hypothetical protein